MLLQTYIWYTNISSKFDFQSPGLKVKVTVAIFRNTLDGFWYSFKQMLGIISSRAKLTFGASELKIKVTKAIFRKFCYGSSAYIHWWILIQLHTNVLYDNISSKFNFRGTSIKVNVVLAIFRKKKKKNKFYLVPTFINEFKYNFMLMFLEQKKMCHRSSAYIYQRILI